MTTKHHNGEIPSLTNVMCISEEEGEKLMMIKTGKDGIQKVCWDEKVFFEGSKHGRVQSAVGNCELCCIAGDWGHLCRICHEPAMGRYVGFYSKDYVMINPLFLSKLAGYAVPWDDVIAPKYSNKGCYKMFTKHHAAMLINHLVLKKFVNSSDHESAVLKSDINTVLLDLASDASEQSMKCSITVLDTQENKMNLDSPVSLCIKEDEIDAYEKIKICSNSQKNIIGWKQKVYYEGHIDGNKRVSFGNCNVCYMGGAWGWPCDRCERNDYAFYGGFYSQKYELINPGFIGQFVGYKFDAYLKLPPRNYAFGRLLMLTVNDGVYLYKNFAFKHVGGEMEKDEHEKTKSELKQVLKDLVYDPNDEWENTLKTFEKPEKEDSSESSSEESMCNELTDDNKDSFCHKSVCDSDLQSKMPAVAKKNPTTNNFHYHEAFRYKWLFTWRRDKKEDYPKYGNCISCLKSGPTMMKCFDCDDNGCQYVLFTSKEKKFVNHAILNVIAGKVIDERRRNERNTGKSVRIVPLCSDKVEQAYQQRHKFVSEKRTGSDDNGAMRLENFSTAERYKNTLKKYCYRAMEIRCKQPELKKALTANENESDKQTANECEKKMESMVTAGEPRQRIISRKDFASKQKPKSKNRRNTSFLNMKQRSMKLRKKNCKVNQASTEKKRNVSLKEEAPKYDEVIDLIDSDNDSNDAKSDGPSSNKVPTNDGDTGDIKDVIDITQSD